MKKNHVNIFIQDPNQYFAQGLSALLQMEELSRGTTVTFLTHQNSYLADLIIVTDDPSAFFKAYSTAMMNTRRNVLLIQDNLRYRAVSQTLCRAGIIKRRDNINTVRQLIETAFKKHNDSATDEALYKSPSLTFREGQILTAIAQGLQPKRIAMQLGVHIKTVSAHKCAAMRKLGFSRNHELYLWLCNQNGLP
ncbi:LuxR C-terminal-related transcriptional regulator [Erwinia persicina]|uniref:helix-turn-helix transcriptional regulator n=1 Tax=Erwinia persicina TaxID=55211 RepID=UPI0021027E95|nr:LuxR C-terminal-related transcriptional regulator [Erwinia persicina]MCQ4107085.1 LuxR C-terminal-related transcriptional regulator [Erwinia persicina]UTX13005.1 LuxR C-terminal-related transcriptional regulator [Erwinia persicina]